MMQVIRAILLTPLPLLILPVLNAQDITGDWYGRLQSPHSYRITLHISKDKKELKATWDYPDRESYDEPVTEISFENDTLYFYLSQNYFSYKGRVNEDFSNIDGKCNEGGSVFDLDFSRKKLLRTLKVDTGSLKVLPVKTRIVKARYPRKLTDAGAKVVKAGNPEVIKIDTSGLLVFTPGIDTIVHPIYIKFPDPVTETEYPDQTGINQYAPVITRAVQPEPIPANPMRLKDAATMNIQYLDVDQTLSFRDIESVMEDSKGNIWIGSQLAGICKYDGKSLTHFSRKEGLPNIWNSTLIEDRMGNLWIGTENGVCKYDGKSFTLYSGGVLTSIISSLESENGDLWFGTNNRGAFVKKGNIWIQYKEDQGLAGNRVMSITEDKAGNLWFGTTTGLCKFDGNSFTHYKEKDGMISNFVYTGIKSKNGNLWFGTTKGLCEYNGNSFRHFTTSQGLSDNAVLEIAEDNKGNLWFNTWRDGLNLYDGNTITQYTKKEGLSSTTLRCIMEDKNGNLWIGAQNGGIMKLQKNSFINFTEFEDISNSPIFSIAEDLSGNIWLGTQEKGLLIYDGESFMELTENEGPDLGIVRTGLHTDRDGNIWFVSHTGLHKYDGNSLTHYYNSKILETSSFYNMSGLHQDHDGNFWFGIWREGLWKMEGKTFITFPKITYRYITTVVQDSRGNIWYGTRTSGVIKYDGEYMTKYSTDEGLSSFDITSLFADETGNLWIGTLDGGINIYDGQTFIPFTMEEGLADNNVRSIIGDNQGNIWIGTAGGLSLLTPQGNGKYSITSFDTEDGLKDVSFNKNAVCLDSRNRLWWGTGHTLTMLDLNSFELNLVPPVIQLSNIHVNQEHIDFGKLLTNVEENEPGSSDSIIQMKTRGMKFSGIAPFCNYPLDLELPHYLDHLTFNYIATEWSAPQSIKYQYMLDGLDKQWSALTAENQADYRNIPPGKYTFMVKAISKAGIWSDTFEYPFIIWRPWWFRWWAYIFYAFVLILIVRYYIRYIISRERIQAEMQIKQMEVEKMQELDKLKSRFFANISHEFRTPLTLLLGPVEDLLKIGEGKTNVGKDILEMMQRNGRKLQLLINQLLDISKLETGKVKLQVSEGNLEELVRTLVNSFLSLAESKQIRFECDMPETERIVYYDSDKLEKILTNLLSNAFKFTPAEGEIVVNLQYVKTIEFDTPQYVEIRIADTGIGIPDEMTERIFDRFYQVSGSKVHRMEGTGIGLALTKELVDLHRGEIHVKSKLGHGSTFSVKLPVSKELFKYEEIVERASDKEEKVESVIQGTGFEGKEEIKTADRDDHEEAKDTPVILIVEDNADLRNYISEILRSRYQIMVAENGKEGLDSAIENIPDLVVSDLMMPVMDGMEMCRNLKTDERTDHIPVVMLTARADRGSKLEGLETGADDYLVKPFDTEELQVRIRNLIKQRKNLKDKFRKEFVSDATDMEASYEDKILNKLMGILDEYVSDSGFSIDYLAEDLHMSRTQVFRKVHALTGYTPNDLLRNLRLKKAASMFRSGHKHIAQVMHQVGFNSQSWFSKCFHEFYGLTPSEYIKQKRV